MGQSCSFPTPDTVATENCISGGLVGNIFRSRLPTSIPNSVISRLSEQSSLEIITSHDTISNKGPRRHLQSICDLDFFYILKMSIVYDNTFCQDHGGKTEQSEAIIRKLVSLASDVYESQLCLTLEIGYLKGYCDETENLFSGLIDNKDPGDRLAAFKIAFNDDVPLKEYEKGLAYFFSGDGTKMNGEATGSAFPRALCRIQRDGYGVIAYSGVTAANCNGALSVLLHETGHNIGGFINHLFANGEGSDVPVESIMASNLCQNCDLFSSEEVKDLVNGLSRQDFPDRRCITETTASPTKTTASPKPSPVSNPVSPIIPLTTMAPTMSPTLTNSESPLAFPDLPPSVISSPTIISSIRPSQNSSTFPIALPATLGTFVLSAGSWYAKKKFFP